ncbi:trigger factor, partial [Sphingomonas sp.]|uniref:trigger factor n=1 Tax=Sphingomonas sp. TaxID=28214 RepID=UPI002898839A
QVQIPGFRKGKVPAKLIDQRTASLARAHPDRADALLADRNRLMQDMGTLFRALAVARPDWPVPAGYGE